MLVSYARIRTDAVTSAAAEAWAGFRLGCRQFIPGRLGRVIDSGPGPSHLVSYLVIYPVICSGSRAGLLHFSILTGAGLS